MTSVRIGCSNMLPIAQILQKCIGVITGRLSWERRNEQRESCLSSQSIVPADTSYSSLDLTLSGAAWKTRGFVMIKPECPVWMCPSC